MTYKIAHISDTHIYTDPNTTLHGINVRQSFQKVLELVKQHNPDYIIHSGDICNDDLSSSYQIIADLLGSLNIPIYFTHGNHDPLHLVTAYFQGKNIYKEKDFSVKNYSFVFVNSVKEGEIYGEITEQEFFKLAETLDKLKTQNIIIVMHHHPILTKNSKTNQFPLRNYKAFQSFIDNYKNIKFVIFGHIHFVFEKKHKSVQYLSTCSTCTTVNSEGDNIVYTNDQIGFRLFEICKNTIKHKIHSVKP